MTISVSIRLPDHGTDDVAGSAGVYRLLPKDAAVVTAGTGYMRSYIFSTQSLPASTFALAAFRCVWQELHRLCAQRAGRGAHSRARRLAAVERAYSDTLFPMGIASPCGSILSAVICVIAFTVLNRRGAFDKLVA